MVSIERSRPFGGILARWDPFQSLTDIRQEMDRLVDSLFGRPATMPTDRMWVPVCDVYETKDEVFAIFELPGVREKDISVSITGDMLTVKGERKWEKELKDESYYRLERAWGKFERALALPVPVQADKVKATCRDGVLEIKLPKAEGMKAREIKVESA